MASLSAKSLKRISTAKFGAVGALEAACTDLGSVMEAEVTASWDTIQATDATLGDMAVEQENTNFAYTFTLTLEDIVDSNVAMALGGTVVGDEIHFSGEGTPTYFCAYLHGFEYKNGGAMKAAYWHIHKLAVAAGTSIPLGKVDGGRKIQITCNVMGYPEATTDYKIMALVPDTADTTAPTVTVVPDDAATGVVVSANVVATFNEAIQSGDVTAKNFFCFKSDGTLVPGALSIDAANEVVTFNPTSNLSAATSYVFVIAAGIHDTAGNATTDPTIINFTTA